MKNCKTLFNAYEHINNLCYKRLELCKWEVDKLKTFLTNIGFTKAQQTVAINNVFEDINDTGIICVLSQTDDGFDWKTVGYRDLVTGDISIYNF